MICTRFAPSPTGYLHVGGLRTALYAYLLAKQQDGKFILRIEDTDRERFVADGTINILKSLYDTGIIPGEGVTMECTDGTNEGAVVQVGKNGPYIQSERLEIYQSYVQKLIDADQAYYCFCSSERLDALRQKQQLNKLPTGYDGHCREYDLEEAKKKIAAGEKYVVRLKMPKNGTTKFTDLIRSEVEFKNELVDDQVLLKSDGFPTYHLAVVVDDHLMEITHVIRGEEWISSTPKHLQLYKYFGWKPPQFAHLPLLLNPDKSKLSKRQGDVAVGDYLTKGYLPEALINFVAFLGWNPGNEKEIFTLEELIREFSLEKVGKAGAVFNLEKLDWYNKEYLKKMTAADLANRAIPWLKNAELINGSTDKNLIVGAINLEKERITTLAELPEAIKFIFKMPDYQASLLVWKKGTAEEVKKILSELKELLDTISVQSWNRPNLEKIVGEWIKVKEYSNGSVLWPLRTALSGQQNSPGPFEIAEVLGKTETFTRLSLAISKI